MTQFRSLIAYCIEQRIGRVTTHDRDDDDIETGYKPLTQRDVDVARAHSKGVKKLPTTREIDREHKINVDELTRLRRVDAKRIVARMIARQRVI